jgi:hypothetical protein
MEHSLPALELSRPWRRAVIVASAVALLELGLIVLLLAALVGGPVAERLGRETAAAPAAAAAAPAAASAQGARPARPAAPAETPILPRTETAVLVLNGNGRTGAAGRAGAEIKGRGYVVAGVGNAPRKDYRRTLVMYRPGKEREAKRLAKDLGGGVVAPLDGITARDLLGAHVAVVLGS